MWGACLMGSRGAGASAGRIGRVLAVLLCTALALGSSAAAATRPDAVVLVSGLTTTTPFTTPSAPCQGTYPRGQTWSYNAAAYAAAGYNVYTAPVRNGVGAVSPHPPLFSHCPAQLPSSMTINSRGDIYANAAALASFIAHLHSRFGVNTVRIVAHSYGGLWTRGALRLASGYFPSVRVESITTLGTPHLGSYLADIGEAVDPALCGTDLKCRAIAYLLIAVRDLTFEPALSQVTAASLAQWNAGQGTSLTGIPVTAIGGDAVSLPGISDPYTSPDDVLVGIQSAQAVGLDRAGVIPSLTCFPAFPDVHSYTFLPFFPHVKYSLLNDPAIASDVLQTLAGNPPATRCPDPAFAASPPGPALVRTSSSRQLTVPLHVAALRLGTLLPRPAAGDVIIVATGTRVMCGTQQLGSVPFLDSTALRVVPVPSCPGELRFAPRGAGVLDLRRAANSVTVSIRGRRIYVRVHGPTGQSGPTVALKQARRFVTQRLDGAHSLLLARGVRTVTLRVAVNVGGGRSALAITTIHLGS